MIEILKNFNKAIYGLHCLLQLTFQKILWTLLSFSFSFMFKYFQTFKLFMQILSYVNLCFHWGSTIDMRNETFKRTCKVSNQ